jgi:hypothetical protein
MTEKWEKYQDAHETRKYYGDAFSRKQLAERDAVLAVIGNNYHDISER